MHLDHLVHVHPGSPSATSTLITSSSLGGDEKSGGVRNHWLSSSAPSWVMWKPFCGPSSDGVVGLDQAVPLEALQGGVHLPHVQRPDLAGSGLELLAQLQPVLGPLAEEGQQGVPDAHERSFEVAY